MRRGRITVGCVLAVILASLIGLACTGASEPEHTPLTAADAVDAESLVEGDVVSADVLAEPSYTLPVFDIASVGFSFCEVDEVAIDGLMSALGRRGQIGQHLMFGVNGSGPQIDALAEEMIATLRPGGVFMGPPLGIVVDDPGKTAQIISSAQQASFAASEVPLWVALDQEGGANSAFNRVTGGTDTLGALPTGATLSATIAFEQFALMGRELASVGFNMALAPVLDTLTSTRNGNLNTRAFGPDPALNAVLGVAAMAGFQHQRVLAVGKHFPGDGLSSENPHTRLVTIDADRATLEETLLVPFQAAINAGIDGMMTMPARFTALDAERSAIISRKVTSDLLRDAMSFEGLVVTDALGMAGASLGLPSGQSAALTALQAGADVLLEVVLPLEDGIALVDEISEALDSGLLDLAEFETSTRRILRMKQRYCLWGEDGAASGGVDPSQVADAVGRPEDHQQMREYASRAITLLHGEEHLPLAGKRILYVGPDTLFQDPGSTWLNVVDQTLAQAMRRHDPDVREVLWVLAPNPALLIDEVQAILGLHEVDVIVLGTIQARFSIEQQQLVAWLVESVDQPIVHAILGVPFDYLQTRDSVSAALAVMGSRSVMVEAAADVLYGVASPKGTMLYELTEGADGVSSALERDPNEDRCATEGIVCGGGGMCVDTGRRFGCVCHPNWHPADDGMDCVPDGQ